MEVAKVLVTRNRATVQWKRTITAGMIGATVSFEFDATWDGVAKTLVWTAGGITKDDTLCTGVIPAEVVAKSGNILKVGVYGVIGDKAIPTVWAELGRIVPGADPSGDESTDPSLPVWAQRS